MVKDGYKQTEIGIIPSDWDILFLPEIANSSSNAIKIGPFGSALKKELLTKNGYKVYGQENIFEKDMSVGDRYINQEHFNKLKSCEIKKNDFLISMMGTIGKCFIVPNEFKDGIIDSHLIRIRINPKKYDLNLLSHIFGSEIVLKQINQLTVGGIMDGLSSKIIKKLLLPIPPKEEQKAIAKALSDTDELINSLEKLISKKEAIKQGTMQQLLTGKKRLSGFTGEWEEKSLEEVVENAGLVRGPFGGALKKEFFVSKGYKVYEQRNAIYKSIEIGSYYIDEEKFQELKRFELSEGDLIVSCSGTIGKIYEIPKNAPKGIINQALLKIKLDNKKIDTNFFLYIFSSNDFQSKIIDNSHGGAMPNLVGMDTFKKTIIHIPKLKEQQAIAGILSDMNKEIDTLKQKLSKTKAIKDGIMSELLTGKTRLKVKDE